MRCRLRTAADGEDRADRRDRRTAARGDDDSPVISGSLLSESALETGVPDALRGLLGEPTRSAARPTPAAVAPARPRDARSVCRRSDRVRHGRGAAARRTRLRRRARRHGPVGRVRPAFAGSLRSRASAGRGRRLAALVVTGWGQDAGAAWRDAVRHGIGSTVSLVLLPDRAVAPRRRQRTHLLAPVRRASTSRPRSTTSDVRVLWGLLRAEAMAATRRRCETSWNARSASREDHRASVRSSLQHGVDDGAGASPRAFAAAVRGDRRTPPDRRSPSTFDESLIVIYRILFLLFAEARGLVPRWHPVYRDGYTIESLRTPVELLPRPRGLWETMQSIARLAHRGLPRRLAARDAFNGRLFSPADSPLAERARLDDGAVRQALLALTTRHGGGRAGAHRVRRISASNSSAASTSACSISSRRPARPQAPRNPRPAGRGRHARRRKATGSFYTPRSLTEYLVRRTLAPLVHGASPNGSSRCASLDPAMGSGAFLVAACRYLAAAYEAALVARAATPGTTTSTNAERAGFRRAVAQRCLYGVDINPMAVQLGRLSLWLATLAADRPLDVSRSSASYRQQPRRRVAGRHRAPALRRSPPLESMDDAAAALRRSSRPPPGCGSAIAAREAIANEPGRHLAAGARQGAARWRG